MTITTTVMYSIVLSSIWVKRDNGIELGLIEGIDKYEIISDINHIAAIQAEQSSS